MQCHGVAPPADIAVELPQIGPVELPPTVAVHQIGRDIGGRVTALQAVFESTADGAERPAMHLGRPALPGKAVLQLDRQRAAQGIQPEHRVRSLQVQFVDRDVRQQVPIHRIGERLIETHAVHVNRQPLGVAVQRGRRKPAINEIRLKLVPLRIAQRHPGNRFLQCPQRRRDTGSRDVLTGQYMGRRRYFGSVEPRTQQGRGADHHDLRQFRRFLRPRPDR